MIRMIPAISRGLGFLIPLAVSTPGSLLAQGEEKSHRALARELGAALKAPPSVQGRALIPRPEEGVGMPLVPPDSGRPRTACWTLSLRLVMR